MTSTRRGALLLAVFGVAAAILHARAGNTYPVPWPDEIDFLTPAAKLARHGTLRVPELGAPEGMFWISDVYSFVLAPVLRFFPATVDVGRMVSFTAIVLAAVGFWAAARKARVPAVNAAVVVGLWLLMSRVVLAGNLARHEALVLVCVAWALNATLHQRRVAALALGVFAVMLHPAAVPFFVVFALVNLRRPDAVRNWEWAVMGVVLALLAVEVIHFGANLSTALDHLRFQAERKAARNGPASTALALVLVAGGGVVARWRAASTDGATTAAGVFLALALAGFSVGVLGQEMWYEVYGMATAPLLLVTAFLVWRPQLAAPRVALLAGALGCLVVAGYLSPFYGMQIGKDSREWNTFVANVEAELYALDASTDAAAIVAVSPLSGLPWPAKTAAIGNVQIVKDTLITTTARPDYTLFARTICCRGKGLILPDLGEIVATVESPHNVFDATLFKTSP